MSHMLFVFKSNSENSKLHKNQLTFDEFMDKNKLQSFLFMHPVDFACSSGKNPQNSMIFAIYEVHEATSGIIPCQDV